MNRAVARKSKEKGVSCASVRGPMCCRGPVQEELVLACRVCRQHAGEKGFGALSKLCGMCKMGIHTLLQFLPGPGPVEGKHWWNWGGWGKLCVAVIQQSQESSVCLCWQRPCWLLYKSSVPSFSSTFGTEVNFCVQLK